jgi:uncharacterized protein (DUF433 family)
MNSSPATWHYLAPKPGSAYRQLFVKGTRIAARLLYGLHVNEEEPMMLEEIAEIAAAYDLPLDAVREAVAYCEGHPPEIERDWQREEAHVQARVIA